jgi:RHS repeat-associated protein
MRRSAKILISLAAILSCVFWPASVLGQSVVNQVNPQNATGLQPYESYAGTRENIDLGNGNVNLQIPLLTLPGRNGHDFSLVLRYDSKSWQVHAETDPNSGQILYYWEGGGGWAFNIPRLDSTLIQPFLNNSNYNCRAGEFVLTSADGSKHAFYGPDPVSGVRTGCYLLNSQGQIVEDPSLNHPTGSANDASYFFLDTSNSSDIVVRAKDGTTMHFPGASGGYGGGVTKIEDTNGNSITFQTSGVGLVQTITDSVGRSVTITSGYPNTLITYKDSSGTQRTITHTRISHSFAATFQNPPNSNPAPFSGAVLDSITLPNNLAWAFQYNTYGELTKITYPTGGYTRYDYAPFTSWIQSKDAAGPFAADFRELTARYVCRAAAGSCSPEDVTTYTPTVDATKTNNQYMDVVSPLGDRTRHQFSYLTNTDSYSNYYSMREILRYHYQGQSTLLRTIQTDFNSLDIHGKTTNSSLPIRQTTTLNDVSPNLVTKTEWDYGPAADNVNEEREYAYGSGSVGTLMRTTDNTWLAVNPVNSQDYTSIALHILNRKASEQIKDPSGNIVAQTQFEYDNYAANGNLTASGAVQHDSAFGLTFTTRGNVTAVKHWRNTDGAWLSTSSQYDDAGNALKITDPLGHQTQFSYSDSWGNSACLPSGGNAAAYVTTITNALAQQTKNTYNSCSGAIASLKDQNDINAGRTGTTYTYDLINRVLIKALPDSGQTSMTYNDVPPVSSTSSTKITSSLNLVATTLLDGLGRPKQSQLTSDPQGTVLADTTYDALGRKSTVSNPYRSTSEATYGVTTSNYDALGRITTLIPPDGTTSANNVATSYFGNCTTVTDQAGKARKSCSDGLGRLTQVFEDPGSSPHMNYETDYTYDPLGSLLTVNQKGGSTNSANWRTRTFTYNSLSQLLTASNPESGTTTYTYDNNGNVLTKKDARNITTTYNYDALNRIGSKSYIDGTESLYYFYDVPPGWMSDSTNVVGRLANTSNSSGGSTDGKATAATFSYDAMGRVIRNWQQTPSTSPGGSFVYQSYNLAGDYTSSKNAAGVTVSYAFDAAARPSTVTSSWTDAQHPATLYTVDPSVGYFPNGAIRKATLANGLTESAMYNSRLQPCRMEINSTAAYFTQCTGAAPSGNVLDFTYGFNSGVSDNGNVANWSAVGNQTFTRSYVYDSVNRISTLSDTATAQTCKGLSWTIDPWGNRTDQTVTAGTCNTFHQATDANNRLLGSPYQYDAAGNMTHDASHSYTYDAENHLTQVDAGATALYIYDPSGNRVRKNSGGSWTEYFYDMSGSVTAEHNSAGWPVEYVYVGGQLVAQYRDGTTYSIFKDHLGSTRLISKLDKTVFDSLDFMPFGEQIAGDTGTTHKFTGKERDSESGLDNFGARYDSSSMGRFMSPDPENVGASLDAPQSWNAYSYVLNNPLNFVDPTGLDCIYVDNDTGKQTGFNPGDCDNSTEEKANSGYYVDGAVDRSSIQTLDNWISYIYKPDGSLSNNIGGQCWGDCPNGATIVTAPLPAAMPVPSFWYKGNPTGDRVTAWFDSHILPGANVISAFTGLDPSYGYCGPDPGEDGPKDADHPKEQTKADKDLNNMKEVKDSSPKRPGPAPTHNPNGTVNAQTVGALSEVPGLVNNGLRCIANSSAQHH